MVVRRIGAVVAGLAMRWGQTKIRVTLHPQMVLRRRPNVSVKTVREQNNETAGVIDKAKIVIICLRTGGFL